MAHFAYKARKKSGEMVEGNLEVADRSAALLQLQRSGMFPIQLKDVRDTGSGKAKGVPLKQRMAALMPQSFQTGFKRKPKPKLQELANYTLQLSNLLRAGMPLTMALHSMSSISSKGIPGYVSMELKQDVMEGRGLSDAMIRQDGVFPDLVINMVRAGEHSGALEEVLRRQSAHFERFAEVQSRFKSAMIYPALVSLLGLGLIFFFTTFMLPKFTEFFESMQVKDGLPLSTRAIIGISDFMKVYWWLPILVVFIIWVLFKRYQSTVSGRRRVDALKMSLPIFGSVIKLNLFGQFARTLATLLINGVPVLNALKITEQVLPNQVLKEAIAATREAVTDGKTLAQPLARSGVFPQLMIDLLKIGEETGDIPGALNNLAETYESDLNVALRTVMSLIEPALIIFLAIVIGGLMVGVMQAMFAITQNIR
jgi:type II secretory pathway component PulF